MTSPTVVVEVVGEGSCVVGVGGCVVGGKVVGACVVGGRVVGACVVGGKVVGASVDGGNVVVCLSTDTWYFHVPVAPHPVMRYTSVAASVA